mgnify:CR=1 FL=1|jgi:hypothetical protein
MLKTGYYRARDTLVRCGLTTTSITKINITIYVPFVSIEDVGGRVLDTHLEKIEIDDCFEC